LVKTVIATGVPRGDRPNGYFRTDRAHPQVTFAGGSIGAGGEQKEIERKLLVLALSRAYLVTGA